MNTKRVFYGMIAGLVVLFIAIIGSAYLANMMLAAQSQKLVDLKMQNQVAEQEKNSLSKAKKDIATYEPLNQIAKAIVPQDKDQAKTVREIIKIAADSGIRPSSITFPVSTLGSKAALAPAASTTTPTAAPAPGATASLSQLKPVKDINGVYILQITITQDPSSPVPYGKFIEFLGRLEQNRRTAQVSNIVLQPSTTDRNQLAFTLTVDEYIKP